jgi:hypothetical protein
MWKTDWGYEEVRRQQDGLEVRTEHDRMEASAYNPESNPENRTSVMK